MKILGVIPARFASSRFPGKVLADIGGKSMIHRVYEQSLKAHLPHKIIVATDDQRVIDEVHAFGGNAVMTSNNLPSGTDRIGEVALTYEPYDVYVNIQGDEPFIFPEQIDQICQCFIDEPQTSIATLIKIIDDPALIKPLNIVKTVLDNDGNAIYFSRAPVPYQHSQPDVNLWLELATYYLHVGLYGYTRDVLLDLCKLPPSPLEIAESLEQLRWLAHGDKIKTALTPIETISIDTPDDILRALAFMQAEGIV